MSDFKKSTRKNKKYMITSPSGKVIHFGDQRYEQYRDKIGKYSRLDHNDKTRRRSYLARSKKIRDGAGRLTWNNPESANFYSIRFLW